ncbi:MAG: hypothetical protein K8W52_31530 [Deltaproteobacteria bacterium]|nr:hypothetical protein [Deltaproteobacteria bacterium]
MSPTRSTILTLASVGAAVLAGACTSNDGLTRPGAAPLECGAAPVHYLIDGVIIPIHAGEQTANGLDLDGDTHVDNGLGNAAMALAGVHPADFNPGIPMNSALAGGKVAWVLSTTTCGAQVRVDLARATDADGDGRYTLEPRDPIAAGGTSVAGHISAREGRGAAPVAMLADPLGTFADPGWIDADALGVDLTVTGDEISGVLGFALPVPDALPVIGGPLAAYFTKLLAAGDSEWAAMIDTDHDGVISVDEFMSGPIDSDTNDSLVGALLSPDLTLYGEGGRYGDSEDRPAKALSAGIGIHAHVVDAE